MPSEDRKAFLLRIDARLWTELEAWAGEELRSVNGQIEFLLRQVVQQRRHRRQVEEKTESSDPNS